MNATRNIAQTHPDAPLPQGYIRDYGRRFMVVIGVNSYATDSSNMPSLKTPVADACRMFQVLQESFGFEGYLLAERRAVCKYEADHHLVGCLEPHVAGNGTCSDILQVLWALSREARPEDLFLFYYGGHGIEESGMGFILPYDTVWQHYDTYLMYPTLFGAFNALPSVHKLLFFDCCFSGVIARDIFHDAVHDGRHAATPGNAPSSDDGTLRPGVDDRHSLILLEPAMASFASTDAFNLAPDQFHYWRNAAGQVSRHSPFADALLECLEKLPAGSSMIPSKIHADIFDGVRQRAPTVQAGDGQAVPLQPVARIVGTAPIFLSKPGLRLVCADTMLLNGEGGRKVMPVEVDGAGDADDIEIELQKTYRGISLQGRNLVLDGSQLPAGESWMVIRARSQGVAMKTISRKLPC